MHVYSFVRIRYPIKRCWVTKDVFGNAIIQVYGRPIYTERSKYKHTVYIRSTLNISYQGFYVKVIQLWSNYTLHLCEVG